MNNYRSSKLLKSSKEGKPNMNDLISELQAFGDCEGVKWTDPTVPPVESYAVT
jgi:hypothetical protein